MDRPVRVDPLALTAEAERLFAAFVAQSESRGAADLEQLCAAHPAQAAELRGAWSAWVSFDALLERADVAPPAAQDLDLPRELPGTSPLAARLARLATPSSAEQRYRLVGPLGVGATSEVLRVRDLDLRRDVAMKVVRAGTGATRLPWGRLSRFLQEAQVLAQLAHPGIPAVYDLGIGADGRLFLTMPLVEAGDLGWVFERVAAGDPEWTTTRAVGVLITVCEALAYAHSRGVVHRDVKPANVLVGAFGTAMVVDWGLAKLVEGPGVARLESDRAEAQAREETDWLVTGEGAAPGTPAYMAPEQAGGDPDRVGRSVDVFAVGAMLYHLLGGRPPHVGPGSDPTRAEVLRRVREERPEPIARLAPGAPEELEAICERAMARDPAERYARMEELAADLRAWIEGRVVRAYRGGLFVPLRKWVRRNRPIAAALGVGLVIAALGVATAVWVDLASRARIRRHSYVGRLQSLMAEADRLHPPGPALVPRLDAWLADARGLAARREGYRRRLAELRAEGRPLADDRSLSPHPLARAHAVATETCERIAAQLAACEAQAEADPLRLSMLRGRLARYERVVAHTAPLLAAPRTFAFDDPEQRREHDQLSLLVEGLDVLSRGHPHDGLIAELEARRSFAASVAERSLERPREAWERAQAEIADRARSPLYDGLAIEPQLGLVPLGADPHTGLQEFVHLGSGEPPRRLEDGRLEYTAHSGIVFVLLPGDECVIGAELPAEAGPDSLRVDPTARHNEGPAVRLRLAPFFLSKFELTHAQWHRMGGEERGVHLPGDLAGEVVVDDLHPVTALPWEEAHGLLSAHGLALPTEAQWEYAARANDQGPWIGAADLEELRPRANFRSAEGGADPDGHPSTSRVGRFAPNAFGFHDLAGNAWEWCADPYWSQPAFPRRSGDGLLLAPYEGLHTIRGGSFGSEPEVGRASHRHSGCASFGGELGVRPTRALD